MNATVFHEIGFNGAGAGVFLTLCSFVLCPLSVAEETPARTEILIADFEGEHYPPGWKVEGTAFGPGPAKGTLPNQMQVSGYEGNGLVDSFYGGDDSWGKLVSPPFRIERNCLSFLLGGGGHRGLAINLVHEGKIVRSAAGPNIVPGGSERLQWHDWDVRELRGEEVHLEILDEIGGSWGHINVDHVIQTDTKKGPVTKRRGFFVEHEYLHLPISFQGQKTWVRVEVEGQWRQEFDCVLSDSEEPDFYAALKIGQWKGKTMTIIAEQLAEDSRALERLRLADEFPMHRTLRSEAYRPQFHYTARIGWINDPNGLVHHEGTWHLFSQHNPYGTQWGNMTWGHATSPDLIHWSDRDEAIHPDKLGTIFSGSGVVDHENTSGFQNGEEKPIVLMFTYSGESARYGAKSTQGIAYSVDGGRTFQKYRNNPVLGHIVGGNRDPKIIRYEPGRTWIMVLYMDADDYAIFGSKNLKDWEHLCDVAIPGCSECPDFFPLRVDADGSVAESGAPDSDDALRWVFWGANGRYLIGSFDGKNFRSETPVLQSIHGGNDYAAMTFSDVPDGRRIQLSWMRGGDFPGMPFNQQYTVPRHLTLRTTPGGVRLFMEPVRELETLRSDRAAEARNVVISDEKIETLSGHDGLLDSQWEFDLGNAKKLHLEILGQRIVYDVNERKIVLGEIRAPLETKNGILKLRLILDRTSIELFAQDGEVQIAKSFFPKEVPVSTEFFLRSEGGRAMLRHANIWKMRSIWKNER